jgi:hypothetical protein
MISESELHCIVFRIFCLIERASDNSSLSFSVSASIMETNFEREIKVLKESLIALLVEFGGKCSVATLRDAYTRKFGKRKIDLKVNIFGGDCNIT